MYNCCFCPVSVFGRTLEWLSADIHHPMPSHSTLLNALAIASQWTKTLCIAEALKNQSSMPENWKPMAEHNGILDALARLASVDGKIYNNGDIRACALFAIERLSNEISTRSIMAENEGIMTALTKATFSESSSSLLGLDDRRTNNVSSSSSFSSTKLALKNLSEAL